MMGSVEISKIDISCTIILAREIIRFITLTEMGHGGTTIRGVPTMLSDVDLNFAMVQGRAVT